MSEQKVLTAVVEANVKPLEKGMADAQKALAETAVEANRLDASIKPLGKSLDDTGKSFTKTANDIGKLDSSVKPLEKDLLSTQKALANTAIEANKLDSKLAGGLTKGSNTAGSSINNLSSLSKLTASNLADMGSSLPIAGFALLTFAVSEGLSALYEYATSIGTIAEANLKVSKSLETSRASVAGQVEVLSALFAIAQDVTKSDAERSQAIGKLNKDYDQFNKSLDLNNINTQKSIDLLGKQTAALILNAQIKGLENLISKETEKRAEQSAKSLSENLSTFQKIKATIGALSPSGAGGSTAIFDAISTGAKNTAEALKESTTKSNIFTESLRKLLEESAAAGSLFTEKLDPLKKAAISAPKSKKTISDVLAELSRQISTINAEQDIFGINTDDYKKKISVIQSAIKELVVKFKLDPKGTLISKLFGDIEDIQLTETVRRIQKSFQDELKGIKLIPPPFETEVGKVSGSLNDYTENVRQGLILRLKALRIPFNPFSTAEGLQHTLDDATARLEKFKVDASAIVQSTAGNIATALGEGLGEALFNITQGTGNPFAALFAGLFKALGAGLKQLGTYAIITSTAIVALKKSIGTTIGIGGGIALVALGALISAAASKIKLPAFANGVTNFSGGMALVGERGPEIVTLPSGSSVIPNHEIGGIDGGGVQVFIPAITLRGSDLVLAFNRSSQSLSRTT